MDLLESRRLEECGGVQVITVLFEVGIQRPPPEPAPRAVVLAAAQRARPALLARVSRLDLPDGDAAQAATTYHALCEGLGGLELRGFPNARDPDKIWRSAFSALVRGLVQRDQ